MQRNLHGRTCPGKSGLAAHVETLGTTNTLEVMAHDTPDYHSRISSVSWSGSSFSLAFGSPPPVPFSPVFPGSLSARPWTLDAASWAGFAS
jgi:hypothetical protein